MATITKTNAKTSANASGRTYAVKGVESYERVLVMTIGRIGVVKQSLRHSIAAMEALNQGNDWQALEFKRALERLEQPDVTDDDSPRFM